MESPLFHSRPAQAGKSKRRIHMKVGIIGAGRIGKVVAKNFSMFVPEMDI